MVPPTQGGSTKNLALIGPAVLEKKMFEIVYDDDGRTDAGSMGILSAHLVSLTAQVS